MTSIKSLEQACGGSFRAFCCSNVFVIGSSTTPKQGNRIVLRSALITLDWLGVALKCLEAVFAERCPECNEHPVPEWYDPGVSLDDLPDAFKGCPVHPADQRACIVAVWSEPSGKWLFAKSYSCLFGIGSVVVSFNRLPALATAVSKRLGICMCAAYFYDLITLESLNPSFCWFLQR